MNTRFIAALLLIALGGVALAYQGYTFNRATPVDPATERSEISSLPPILGWIALIGGIVLLVSKRKNSDRTSVLRR